MRILITGANGMLGRALAARLEAGHTLYLWGREEADLTPESAVNSAAQGVEFDAIVHAAAMTDVDGCESQLDRAMAANRDTTRILGALARGRGASLLYVSTDYVFDGTNPNPYLEEDAPNPINAYGRSKLAGEEAARSSGAPYLVVRTSWLYGPSGKNFVDTIAARLALGEPLRVVDDQRGAPTYTLDLAHGIELLLRRGATGIVNATNSGSTTWHGFATEIARYLGISVPVVPVSSAEFPRPAKRPANSVLSGARFRALTGESLRPWEEGLHHYLDRRRAAAGEAA
jgi:dTDP-4-dehydrorhamnose reductase